MLPVRLSTFSLLAALVLATALPGRAVAQSSTLPIGNTGGSDATIADLARRLRIVDNLKYQIPQLRERDIVVTELNPGGEDLDDGTLFIDGQQQMRFVISKDDRNLYLLAAPPIDVSRSSAELAKMREADKERELVENATRHERLLAMANGLPSRGNPDAQVIIFEFSDFQCPYCAGAADTIHELLEKRGDDFSLVYMHLPLNIHPWARPAAVASVCVANQDVESFWALHDFYFDNQSTITAENVVEATRNQVARLGIDVDTWNACATDETSEEHTKAADLVDSHLAVAAEFRIGGTPAFYVNGEFINGAKPLEDFEAAIDRALDQ